MKNSSLLARIGFTLFAGALLIAAAPNLVAQTATVPQAEPTMPPYQSLTPVRILGIIRRVYREHRPPPPYETYTLTYSQMTTDNEPDYAQDHVKHYWVRNSDRAALVRLAYHDDFDGDMTFDRPALNQPRDPGPPTADLFEPAHPQPVDFVPTPEPSLPPLKTIGTVVAFNEPDYTVSKMAVEGEELHLWLAPKRDPERNVLRELWVDKHTYVLKRLIAHDRMFIDGTNHIYPMRVVYTLGYLQGYVVITHFDATVLPASDPDYSFEGDTDDKPEVTIDFTDITFPASLPDWYFDPRQYRQHAADAPT